MGSDFEDWEADLASRVERGLKYGKSLGVDSSELYITNSYSLNTKIKGDMIDGNQGGNIGVACRCVTNKKVGFSSASGIENSAVNFAIESAFNISKVLPNKDDRWQQFVNNKKKGKDGKIESSVFEIESDKLIKDASKIFQEAKNFDNRINSIEGMISTGYGAFALGNTEGITKTSKRTFGSAEIYIVAKENDKTKTVGKSIIGRGVPELSGVGESAAKDAVKLLKAKPLKRTEKLPVLFDNETCGSLINVALMNSVNGQSVVEKRTKFADKIGESVGVSSLTIIDDGQLPSDPSRVAIDDEGFPRKSTNIIENGILKNFIFNNYYSNIYDSENTGNATRRGPQTYESIPMVSLNTLSVPPSNKDLQQIISELDDAILAKDMLLGMFHSDTISGDFSIVAPNCYLIKDGEIETPLESISIAGNLYEVFNQIIALGNETEITKFGKVPSMAFKDLSISG
ncbi:MAG: TldD/PmbA family protein [Promethearchaeota archaeon]|nr:MAG: TldD/PmbA family protein [Candidatus Lokiarchaeota archaeon]